MILFQKLLQCNTSFHQPCVTPDKEPIKNLVSIKCAYCVDILLCVRLAATAQFLLVYFNKLNNRTVTKHFSYINTSCILLCWFYCFFHVSRHFKHSLWTHCKHSLKEYTYHMHINFLQLVTVSLTSLNIGHTSWISIYKLLLCQFWDSQSNRTWIYANLWVSLCISLAFASDRQF